MDDINDSIEIYAMQVSSLWRRNFVEPDSSNQVCLDCGRNIEKPMVLKVDKFRIPLFQGQKIYNVQLPVDGDLNAIVGEVVRHSMTNDLELKIIRHLLGKLLTLLVMYTMFHQKQACQ